MIITFCYASVVRVVWRHGRDEVQTSTKDGGSALRRTVRDARYISRAKIKTIKVFICSRRRRRRNSPIHHHHHQHHRYLVAARSKKRSYHSSRLISTDLVSSEPGGSECTAKRPSLPWLRPVGRDDATYFVSIGLSHGKLSRFAARSL